MKIITKSINVDNYSYYRKHLEILNVLLPVKLSQKEVEVLAAFMSQDIKLIEDSMFNIITRKNVMSQLKMQPGGLGNHLKTMIEKGYLIKNKITNEIKVKEYLLPEKNNQGYRLRLNKK